MIQQKAKEILRGMGMENLTCIETEKRDNEKIQDKSKRKAEA